MFGGTNPALRMALRWRVLPVALIWLVAGLGPVPAAAVAVAARGTVSSAHLKIPGTAYVSGIFGGLIPIDTATNAAGPPINIDGEITAIAITPDGHTAYVAHDGPYGVTPVNTATNTAGPTIPAGSYPAYIAITPNGQTAYVVDGMRSQPSDSTTVIPIDTATNTAGAPITVGSVPRAIAIIPDGKTAYVLTFNIAYGQALATVTPINTATNTAGTPIPIGTGPAGGGPATIAITPDGKTAYVTDGGNFGVTPIDTATNTADPSISVGGGPAAIVMAPDGKTAYVAVGHIDGTGDVVPIDTATNITGTPIPVPAVPSSIAITPNGKTAYVVSSYADSVTPVNLATSTAGQPITVGSDPDTIAITPDSKTAYVLNYLSATVTPIRTRTNTAGPAIPVGGYPHVIAITPPIVPESPAFTSGTADTAAFGSPSTFTVTTTGIPAPGISRTGRLPSGMRFTDNRNRTATISGTPASGAAGTYPLTFTAKNEAGTAAQAFTLTVTRAPYMKKVHTVRAREGMPLNRIVRAIGYPAPALTESGPLPAGLSFTDKGNGTAAITGTPANGSSGRYRITITATNASGTTTRPVILLISPH